MDKLMALAMLFAVAGPPTAGQIPGVEEIEIPLRVMGGRFFVPVETSDGAKLEFLLSTGTPMTVFSESAAARLGDRPELTMGGVAVDTENSRTLPDEDLTVDGQGIDGMIGPGTLNKFDVLVDAPGGRLVLRPVGRSVAWEGMTMSDPIRLRVYHGVLLGFDVEFNGREYPAMLDLGTPSLVVNEPVKTETQIEAEDEGTLSLGATTVPNLPVRVLDLPLFRQWDPNNQGFVIVGAPVAYGCAVSISWVHREIRTCVR